MRLLCSATVLILSAALFAEVEGGAAVEQVKTYETKIGVVNELIDIMCPTVEDRKKREVEDIMIPNVLQVLHSQYAELIQELIDCTNSSNYANLDLLGPVIATGPLPHECENVTTLSQSWRRDSYGSDFRGGGPHSYYGYACDLRDSLHWFRIRGAAGNRILNTCPHYKSCGTEYPLWSDVQAPEEIGVAITGSAYAASSSNCKRFIWPIKVMRCSHRSNDVIYKYVLESGYVSGTSLCNKAFCGME